MKVERSEIFVMTRDVGSSRNDEKFVGRGRGWGNDLDLQKARFSLDIKENFVGARCLVRHVLKWGYPFSSGRESYNISDSFFCNP